TPAVVEELNAPYVWPESENIHTMTPIIVPLSEAPAFADPTAEPTTLTGKESEEAELVLRFTGDSWVEVRDKHDRILYYALEKSGGEKTLIGVPPFSLLLGNGDAVTVMLRGKTIDLGDHNKQDVARLKLE
ncbi:MAG: DUF4115 domain-containing protein, partial [Burkholderiales bacterium]|nr:DUF4115 domain-containing protein [Burkholderiales bacterium]